MKMSYPKSVYHKDYDPNHHPEHEKHLVKNSKVVHSKEELEKLGPQWGEHPHSKEVEEPKAEERKIEAPKEEKKKPGPKSKVVI